MFEGLDHVQLAMPPGEEQAARHFYGEILGLPELPKPAPLSARGGCWFGTAVLQLHLGIETDFRPARKAHPALLVDDLDGLAARLHSAGVAIRPDDAVPGVQRFYADDPFGNRLEFIQSGTGFLRRASAGS